MRYFLALLLLVGRCYGRNIPAITGPINYSEVVTLDSSFTKTNLFINAKKFFVDVFVSGKAVIQMEDKEEGIVIGKGYLVTYYKANFMYNYKTRVTHTIKISIKDGKYKFEIIGDEFEIELPPGNGISGKSSGSLSQFPKHNKEKFFADLQKSLDDEIVLLKTYMSKKQSTDF